jgi:RimJ/RimL family protein N-acetyltransferase
MNVQTPNIEPILIDLPLPLFTPRLKIRDCQSGDGPELLAARLESDSELRPWMPFARGPRPTLQECEASCRQAHARFILREDLRLSVFDRTTGAFVASTGLHRFDWKKGIFEIGYWVRTSRAGQGVVTEAVNAVTRYAFQQLGAKRVSIHCNAENLKSRAVAERLGFNAEARLSNIDRYADDSIACRDEIIYARCSPDGLPDLEVSW